MLPNTNPERHLQDPDYERLKARVIELTGLVYYVPKDSDFCLQLDKRINATNVKNCGEYLELLRDGYNGKEELDSFIIELTIGETYFFRHREQFDALRDHVIPEILARKVRNGESKTLRIWSAGCSIGAEPYTMAMLLRENFLNDLVDWQVNIWGTDINRAFLRRARDGLFDEWAFRTNSDAMRLRHFTPLGKQWLIRSELKQWVNFDYENLVRSESSGPWLKKNEFDLIICRNVMIYFDAPILGRLIPLFHESLRPDGWLMVGHAEQSIESYAQFEAVNFPGAIIYKKGPGSASKSPFDFNVTTNPFPPPSAPAPLPPASPAGPKPAAKPITVEQVKALADSGDIRAALDACTKSIAADKLNPVIFFYYGLLLHQKGSLAEAESAMLSAISLDAKFCLAHYYLGVIQKSRGDLSSSRSFRNALELARSLSDSTVIALGDGLTVRELKHLAKLELGEA